MKLKDLKSGMKVTTRSGNKYLVIRDYDVGLKGTGILCNMNKSSFISLSAYNEKLECDNDSATICDVYVPKSEGLILSKDMDNFNLLWKREECTEPSRFMLNKKILDEVLGILRTDYTPLDFQHVITCCKELCATNPTIIWVWCIDLLQSTIKLGATDDTVYEILRMLDCEVISIGN